MGFFKKLKKNIGVEETPTDEQIMGDEDDAIPEAPIQFVSENISENTIEEAMPKKEKKRFGKKAKCDPTPEPPETKQIFVQAIEELPEEKEASSQAKNSAEIDWLKANGQLAVDIYEAGDDFCVKSAIAGVNSDELDVFIDNAMLVIKGERCDPEPEISPENKKYFYQECYWGPFTRQILLPDNSDNSKIKATLKKGILTVKVPKIQDKKRKIAIEIGE